MPNGSFETQLKKLVKDRRRGFGAFEATDRVPNDLWHGCVLDEDDPTASLAAAVPGPLNVLPCGEAQARSKSLSTAIAPRQLQRLNRQAPGNLLRHSFTQSNSTPKMTKKLA